MLEKLLIVAQDKHYNVNVKIHFEMKVKVF